MLFNDVCKISKADVVFAFSLLGLKPVCSILQVN